MINIKENQKLNVLNHSCAHLLAHAVKHLYPRAKFWVGPVIEEGFYYDIDLGDDVISEDDLPRIFERFYRVSKSRSTSSGGTGLGLSIVRNIVQSLGGRIDVMSQLNEGSEFRVLLPKNTEE